MKIVKSPITGFYFCHIHYYVIIQNFVNYLCFIVRKFRINQCWSDNVNAISGYINYSLTIWLTCSNGILHT